MPTLNEVIDRVDAIKLNPFRPEEKTAWLSEIDGKISLNLLGVAEAATYTYPDDSDKELLVGAPYDRLYDYYLYSMIDFNSREYENYNNSTDMFNEAYEEYAKWYRRNNRPASSPDGFYNL
jgi:hypothetical protein